jgi:hypothetical protein
MAECGGTGTSLIGLDVASSTDQENNLFETVLVKKIYNCISTKKLKARRTILSTSEHETTKQKAPKNQK